MAYTHPYREPAYRSDAVVEHRPAFGARRVLQVLAGLCGAALFAIGLVATFRVDFGDAWLDTTAAVAGFGFSAVVAIAAVVMGAAILVSTFAEEDRASAATAGLLTLVLGIVGLVVRDNPDADVKVAGRTAGLFVVLGAAVFVMALVPWWTARRTTVVRERIEP
ncbi:MAG: hypothetical protein U0P45_09515 [Acidimicrobiales bacterium]